MSAVVINPPTSPELMPARRMAMRALTRVFPSSRVQSSRFPRFLRGRILDASFLSKSEGEPSMTINRSSTENDMRPRLRPEKRPERAMRAAARRRSEVIEPRMAWYSVEATQGAGSAMA